MASKSCTSSSSNESKILSRNREWSQQLGYVLTLDMDRMICFLKCFTSLLELLMQNLLAICAQAQHL